MRERAALINGTADATTTRDEGWHFLMLGRCVERADMTSRLVATAALSGAVGAPWTTTLRACGAYEAFLRTYRGLETERGAAEFLLLDRLFPRSVVFALNRAEQCVDNLEAAGQRAGFQNEAQRLLGRTRAELEYRSLSRPDERPARTRWSGCSAPARRPPRRSPAATSPAPRPWCGKGSRGDDEMSMQLRIVHTTGYEYDGKAVASYNQARMTPVTTPEQIVVHSRLEVSPKPWTYEYRDYFGTHVTAFEVVDPHDSLTVTRHLDGADQPATAPRRRRPTWDELRDPRGRRPLDRVPHPARARGSPPMTSPGACARCQDAARSARRGRARRCARWWPTRSSTGPGATDVQTPAAAAWSQRAGVCQDMVHLVIGGAAVDRHPGPLRLRLLPPRRRPGRSARRSRASRTPGWSGGTTAGAPSTWPTSEEPSDRYVTVAFGRDYADVKPLSGIYSGAETSGMFVTRRGHPARLNPRALPHWSRGWAGRATASTYLSGDRGARRGKSGLHRARWWATPTRGNPRESATENRPPRSPRRSVRGKGETVVQETTSDPGDRAG